MASAGSAANAFTVTSAPCFLASASLSSATSTAATRTHWPVSAPSSLPRVPNLDLCPEHGNPRRDCLDCRREQGPELTPEQIRAKAKAVRAQIADQQRKVREGNAERRRTQTGATP